METTLEPEGDVVADRVAGVRGVFTRADHAGLARDAGGRSFDRGLRRDAFLLPGRQPRPVRPVQLRRVIMIRIRGYFQGPDARIYLLMVVSNN